MPSRVDYYDTEYPTQSVPSRKNSAGFPLLASGYAATAATASTSGTKAELLDKFIEAHDELQGYRSAQLYQTSIPAEP